MNLVIGVGNCWLALCLFLVPSRLLHRCQLSAIEQLNTRLLISIGSIVAKVFSGNYDTMTQVHSRLGGLCIDCWSVQGSSALLCLFTDYFNGMALQLHAIPVCSYLQGLHGMFSRHWKL